MRTKTSKPISKRLRRVGNSVGVLLPKAVLNQLDLQPDSFVDLRVEGDRLVLRKGAPPKKEVEPRKLSKFELALLGRLLGLQGVKAARGETSQPTRARKNASEQGKSKEGAQGATQKTHRASG